MKAFSPDDKILDKSYQDWIVSFWRQEQDERDDGVYLLLPDFDDSMAPTLVLPAQKRGILISPINFISVDEEGDATEKEMKEQVKYEIDIINKDLISLKWDGQELGWMSSRVGTPFFELEEDGRKKKAISDGYWLFLKGPFEKGEHELTSFGTCRAGQIQSKTKTVLNLK